MFVCTSPMQSNLLRHNKKKIFWQILKDSNWDKVKIPNKNFHDSLSSFGNADSRHFKGRRDFCSLVEDTPRSETVKPFPPNLHSFTRTFPLQQTQTAAAAAQWRSGSQRVQSLTCWSGQSRITQPGQQTPHNLFHSQCPTLLRLNSWLIRDFPTAQQEPEEHH